MTGNLALPQQQSLDRLSPDDGAVGRRVSAASINAASGRRGSTMSNFSRRSSDYDIPNDVDEFPETNEDEIKEEEGETGRYNPNDSVIHEAIPSLPLKAAIVCLILNLVIPGSGTLISGLLAVYLGENYFPPGKDSGSVFCTNMWVGLSQTLTIPFLLVGWFWSLAWGVYMVQYALDRIKEEKRNEEIKKQKELKEKALKAFKGKLNFPLGNLSRANSTMGSPN